LTPLARIIAFTDEVQVTQPHETRFSIQSPRINIV